MAAKHLVRTLVGEGARMLLHLTTHQYPVTAAAWISREEVDRRRLWIASSLVEEEGTLAAYSRLRETLRGMTPQPAIELDAVTVTRSTDPLLIALSEAAADLGSPGLFQIQGTVVSDYFVDEALAYWPVPRTQADLDNIFIGL